MNLVGFWTKLNLLNKWPHILTSQNNTITLGHVLNSHRYIHDQHLLSFVIMTSHVHTHSMVLLFTVSLNYTFFFLFTAPIQSTSSLPSSPAPVSLMNRTGVCSTKCMSTYTISFSCIICKEHCPPARSKHVPAPKLIPSRMLSFITIIMVT